MATKHVRVVTCGGRGGNPSMSRDLLLRLRGHVANEKKLYLHFHNTCAHQTWQAGILPSKDPTYLVR